MTVASSPHDEDVCQAYCDLYFKALTRCPYSTSSKALDKSTSCVQACLSSNVRKNGTPYDFSLQNTVQCRMNHAKMAIVEGALTNSLHCLHATLEGPERCVSDKTAVTQNAVIAAAKKAFYAFPTSTSMQRVGSDPSSIMQHYILGIQYQVALRG